MTYARSEEHSPLFDPDILFNGGTVATASVLANRAGQLQALALATQTWDQLTALFGDEFDAFWKKEVGHDANCLTEAEGKVLLDWARKQAEGAEDSLLQRLRAYLSEITTKSGKSEGTRGSA
jgi:hypothetical protein